MIEKQNSNDEDDQYNIKMCWQIQKEKEMEKK